MEQQQAQQVLPPGGEVQHLADAESGAEAGKEVCGSST
jgi:hypothetical protein